MCCAVAPGAQSSNRTKLIDWLADELAGPMFSDFDHIRVVPADPQQKWAVLAKTETLLVFVLGSLKFQALRKPRSSHWHCLGLAAPGIR